MSPPKYYYDVVIDPPIIPGAPDVTGTVRFIHEYVDNERTLDTRYFRGRTQDEVEAKAREWIEQDKVERKAKEEARLERERQVRKFTVKV